jgi:dihydroorotase
VAAGVFTQPFATQLVLLALEDAVERGVIGDDDVTQEKLELFLSRAGRRFYKLPEPDTGVAKIVLERKGETIPASIKSSAEDGVEVGLSKAGAAVFSLRWVS